MRKKPDPFDLSCHAGHRPVGELAYAAIRQAISQGLLAPGQRLVTEDLSARMKVSRTPIREALRKLETDGLVRSEHWRGVVVAELPPLEEMEEFYALRGALEGLVAYFAARRRPLAALRTLGGTLERMEAAARTGSLARFKELQVDFWHEYIGLASSRRMQQIASSIGDALARAKPISLSRPGRMKEAVRELRAVYDAIEAGDAERAEELAREHCRRAYAAYRDVTERAGRGARGTGT
ncbi:MAG TPA: GntR family transcriptional regulator [Anaeromyxobacter sp.]|nr:GntR family transcriptional regulator [Anaeromyxobacter sp.]